MHYILPNEDDAHYFFTVHTRFFSITVLAALTLVPLPRAAAHGVGGSFGAGPPAWAGSPAWAGPPSWAEVPRSASGERGSSADSHGAHGEPYSASAEARKTQAHELWRAHRDQLDFDPDGQLVVRDEILAFAPSGSALSSATSQGFAVRRQQALAGLGSDLFVLTPPHGLSARRALKRLRSSDPEGAYDYNHIYFQTASARVPSVTANAGAARSTHESSHIGGTVLRIGLIDGGVETDHAALRDLTVRAHGCNGTQRPSEHGTAVASLLPSKQEESGRTGTRIELFAADVYCGAPAGGAADALSEALAWLVDQQVAVINVSLVGPPNALLQRMVQIATDRGHLIVASVGNDGPAAAPLYPAAYPGVVAVTGVDRNDKVLMEAGRGPYVHFAAPGADIEAARVPEGSADVRGTSFAAPIVAALLAARLERPDKAQAAKALRELEAQALDLGAPGVDPVYGYGCLGCERALPIAATHPAP